MIKINKILKYYIWLVLLKMIYNYLVKIYYNFNINFVFLIATTLFKLLAKYKPESKTEKR